MCWSQERQSPKGRNTQSLTSHFPGFLCSFLFLPVSFTISLTWHFLTDSLCLFFPDYQQRGGGKDGWSALSIFRTPSAVLSKSHVIGESIQAVGHVRLMDRWHLLYMPSAPRDRGEAHVQTSVALNEWTEFFPRLFPRCVLCIPHLGKHGT